MWRALFCFCFDFVCSHARWGYCLFHSLLERIKRRSGGGGRLRKGSFKIGCLRSTGMGKFWTYMDRAVGGLENYTIFMGVICVSSLNRIQFNKTQKAQKDKKKRIGRKCRLV